MAVAPASYADFRGLFTCANAPTVQAFHNMGFNIVCPFSWSGSQHLGEAGIAMMINGEAGAKSPDVEARYSIWGYFVAHEPEYTGVSPDTVLERIRRCRAGTNKPITIINAESAVAQRSWDHERVWPELDFVYIDSYPYRGGGLDSRRMEHMETAINMAHSMGKPVVAISQAHEDPAFNTTRPDMWFLDSWLRERGCGVIWYAWEASHYPSIGSGKRFIEGALRDQLGDAWYNEQITRINGKPWPWAPTYTCPLCGATFSSQTELDAHIWSEHPVEPPAYTCPHCGATFYSQADLDSHIATVHPTEPTYTCPHCGASFGSQAELSDHIASAHPVAAEVSWYEKYIPFLAIGGAIGTTTTYFILKK